ncbi:hypothetical protein K1I29_002364 [Salmonella enterica subsp. enterica serovar Johannesburg]|nr:hypothetical protein [Salmonella enterica subsp. enterica serovar Johannesburg]
MKKTLIALAVAASAAVSGSAMAWTANGTGGNVELGGTLTPVAKVTPWAVKVGSGVTNLNADITKGQQNVDIEVKNAIPVLGIRTQTQKVFLGQPGISPQIDFKGAINVANFKNSETTLSINVTDSTGAKKIGTLSAPLLAGAEYNYDGVGQRDAKAVMFASSSGMAFFGGLPTSKDGSLSNPYSRVAAIDPEFVQNYVDRFKWSPNNGGFEEWNFTDSDFDYSAFYGSGIEAGAKIQIRLDTPAAADAIAWKASLPVTVSYM